ncbi:S-formylglutathione hydrolase [Hyphococcus luteus]|uniref:S-formylglutathione hydrolase n=1 Tax=Hyphococcus luteus TaxID=2058213 RepID=A0A2S7K395_9PROT|nr:S-formylglutathione hydrolase [Marinicaulis flavus]PQA86984.1 S-formylglutathione hydrolase [Marinicaulis flavus]
MEQKSAVKSFGGTQGVYSHASETLSCDMNFAVYVPEGKGPFPVLYWLSGLTCTEENFITKACAQRVAAELGLVIVAPDTSPRGEGVPDDPDGAYDFGLGAGFYLNATEEPWSTHYKMYDYVTKELPTLIEKEFLVDAARAGIFGHSMGGHGAMTIHLKNSATFKTCSAFSPIVAPSQVPWGKKAFSNYLGPDEKTWIDYDAAALVSARPSDAEILIDQGTADNFLEEQLKPEIFAEAATKAGQKFTLRMQEGYDHSYYFIASFIEDHLRWHAGRL